VRVLVVEDDPSVATGVQHCLAADGLDVEVVHDGAVALARARADEFDLIVLDILLPSLNGYRVCESIRSDDDWTPILMLTAKAGEYDEAEGLETGADDFLVKPFSTVVLQARVRALLRRPLRRTALLSAGDLRLDLVRRRCVRGSHAVELSGETVTKTELLHAVWGATFEGNPNIVEVYIRHLRRKLDEPFGRCSIETVRGVGYRVRVEEPA
jgi:two-component system, OmpR family, response regulator